MITCRARPNRATTVVRAPQVLGLEAFVPWVRIASGDLRTRPIARARLARIVLRAPYQLQVCRVRSGGGVLVELPTKNRATVHRATSVLLDHPRMQASRAPPGMGVKAGRRTRRRASRVLGQLAPKAASRITDTLAASENGVLERVLKLSLASVRLGTSAPTAQYLQMAGSATPATSA